MFIFIEIYFLKNEVPLPCSTLTVFGKLEHKYFHIVSARVEALCHVFQTNFEKSVFKLPPYQFGVMRRALAGDGDIDDKKLTW